MWQIFHLSPDSFTTFDISNNDLWNHNSFGNDHKKWTKQLHTQWTVFLKWVKLFMLKDTHSSAWFSMVSSYSHFLKKKISWRFSYLAVLYFFDAKHKTTQREHLHWNESIHDLFFTHMAFTWRYMLLSSSSSPSSLSWPNTINRMCEIIFFFHLLRATLTNWIEIFTIWFIHSLFKQKNCLFKHRHVQHFIIAD
jgi:hypothetical protein